MPELLTYDDFIVLNQDLRLVCSYFFITKGLCIDIVWDNSLYTTRNQSQFTWEATVKLRKFYSKDGSLVKPEIKFSDIHPTEGNTELSLYKSYYNSYPEVFPRFLYNRQDMRDEKENGVGIKYLRKFGIFRLYVSNNGIITTKNVSPMIYNSGLYINDVNKLSTHIPEYNMLITAIEDLYTPPFVRAQKRNSIIKRELYISSMGRTHLRFNSNFDDKAFIML